MWLLSRAPKRLREAEFSPRSGLRRKRKGKPGAGEEAILLGTVQRIPETFKILDNLLNLLAGKLWCKEAGPGSTAPRRWVPQRGVGTGPAAIRPPEAPGRERAAGGQPGQVSR